VASEIPTDPRIAGHTSAPGRGTLRGVVLGVLFMLLSALILTARVPPTDDVAQLRVGDVAQRDVLAPRRIIYISAIETEAARARAEAAVPEIFDLPDASIARRQIARARQILDYFDSVRADMHATPDEKRELVAAVNDLVLTDGVISRLLTTDSNTWVIIKGEVVSVLDQAMRAEIRSTQLAAARRRLPTLVSLDVSDEAARIIGAIVEDLIQPNTFVNQERTAEERRLARESVQPISVTYEQNESILRAGQVIRAQHIEALQALGLKESELPSLGILSMLAYVVLLGLAVGLYVWRFRPRPLKHAHYVWLTFGLSLVFLALARLMIPGHTLLPYLFPAAALAVTLGALIDIHFGMLVAVLVGLTVGHIAGDSLELAVYATVGGLMGVTSLGRVERVNRLLWAGIYVALCNVLIVLIFRVPGGTVDPIGLLQLVGTALVNGALSASLPLLVFFVAGNISDITTSLQLLDLSRPTQPLLRQLLLKAPGTYHHSLLVSNLSEQAAERIGANTLLTRVGAYYHDIGKMARPYFFVENQIQGDNVQDRLDPLTSAQIIVNHVRDGLEMAKKYRIPGDVRAFIAEHQGTGVTRYFYQKALDATDDPAKVDESEFRYPGPRPQSKETAIVMLADASEAAVRASNPSSVEEIDDIVRKLIADRLMNGELDDCDLTMGELREIRNAFVQMLQGAFHPRIKYPEKFRDKMVAPVVDSVAAPSTESEPSESPAGVAGAVTSGEASHGSV
jgi:putative nucleotidyltransferase with HDIG domain